MLSWLPIVGPLISKFFDYLNKAQDIGLEKYKVDGQVDMSLIQAETEILKARAALASNLSWAHYFFIVPTAFYYAAILFDAITEKIFGWSWDVQPLGGAADVWAGMVMGLLFLHSGLKTLVRR